MSAGAYVCRGSWYRVPVGSWALATAARQRLLQWLRRMGPPRVVKSKPSLRDATLLTEVGDDSV